MTPLEDLLRYQTAKFSRLEMMSRNLIRKLDQMLDSSNIASEQRFFGSIYGYDEIKRLLLRCILVKGTTLLLAAMPFPPLDQDQMLLLLFLVQQKRRKN
jgi:hypothetical protein